MTGIWWTSVSIEIFLCSLTATTTHLLMSLGKRYFTGISAIVASEEGSPKIIYLSTTLLRSALCLCFR
jgi:hypothetical protein